MFKAELDTGMAGKIEGRRAYTVTLSYITIGIKVELGRLVAGAGSTNRYDFPPDHPVRIILGPFMGRETARFKIF